MNLRCRKANWLIARALTTKCVSIMPNRVEIFKQKFTVERGIALFETGCCSRR